MGAPRDLAAPRAHLASRAHDCGSAELAGAFHDFIQAWGRCMDRDAQESESLAKALKAAAGAYERIENAIKAGPS